MPKSGEHTAGVDRQWCGNLGKVDNCVVGVHLVYAAPGFQCLLGSRVYLPEEWANDAERRKQNYIPEEVQFRTKPQIALEQIDRALGNGIAVAAWTCDEFYGRSSEFLDGLEQRKQIFVAEVPVSFHGWVRKLRVLRQGPKSGRGRRKSILALPGRFPPARFAIWFATLRPFATDHGNDIGSKIQPRGLRYGKSNGRSSGARVAAGCRLDGSASSSPATCSLGKRSTSFPTAFPENAESHYDGCSG